jgi:hypothetical protein
VRTLIHRDAPMNAPAAGWYQNPAGSGGFRSWDGFAWTSHVQMPQAAPVEPAAPVPSLPADQAQPMPERTAAPGPVPAPTFAPAPGFEPSREMDVAPGLDQVTLVPQPARLAAGNDVVSGANQKVAVEDSQSSNTEPKQRLDLGSIGTNLGIVFVGARLGLFGLILPWAVTSGVGGCSSNAFPKDLPWWLTGGTFNNAGVESGVLADGLLFSVAFASMTLEAFRMSPYSRFVTPATAGVTLLVVLAVGLSFRSEFGDVSPES